MRFNRNRLGGLCVAVLIACCGCNQPEMQRWHEENVRRWNEFFGEGGSPFGRRVGDVETWTIECNEYQGPAAGEMADSMAAALKRVETIKADAVWVKKEPDRGHVYYGNYDLKYVEAQVDSESHAKGDIHIELNDGIKRDLRLIRTLAMGDQYPFFSARPVPKPTEDVGPPDWDLRNAKGVYSLNIGVTYNTPTLHNHKEAAVEWVKALREQGFEAYYYHAPDGTRSSVCVGTFGEDALVTYADGRPAYSQAVNALRNEGDFTYNLENGHRTYRKATNPETGNIERMPNLSFLVKIP